MYRVVVHRRVVRKLRVMKGAHLNRFSELVETLQDNPVPWRTYDIRKIEGLITPTGLGLETAELSIILTKPGEQYTF